MIIKNNTMQLKHVKPSKIEKAINYKKPVYLGNGYYLGGEAQEGKAMLTLYQKEGTKMTPVEQGEIPWTE